MRDPQWRLVERHATPPRVTTWSKLAAQTCEPLARRFERDPMRAKSFKLRWFTKSSGPPAAPAPAARCQDRRRSPGRGEYRSCFSVGSRLSGGPMWGSLPSGLYISLLWCLCIYAVARHLYSVYITCVRVCAPAPYRSSCVCWLDWFPAWISGLGPRDGGACSSWPCGVPPTHGKGRGNSGRPPKSYPLQFSREGVCLC